MRLPIVTIALLVLCIVPWLLLKPGLPPNFRTGSGAISSNTFMHDMHAQYATHNSTASLAALPAELYTPLCVDCNSTVQWQLGLALVKTSYVVNLFDKLCVPLRAMGKMAAMFITTVHAKLLRSYVYVFTLIGQFSAAPATEETSLDQYTDRRGTFLQREHTRLRGPPDPSGYADRGGTNPPREHNSLGHERLLTPRLHIAIPVTIFRMILDHIYWTLFTVMASLHLWILDATLPKQPPVYLHGGHQNSSAPILFANMLMTYYFGALRVTCNLINNVLLLYSA